MFTNEWPAGVTNRAAVSDIPVGVSDSSCTDVTVTELVMEVKPRLVLISILMLLLLGNVDKVRNLFAIYVAFLW